MGAVSWRVLSGMWPCVAPVARELLAGDQHMRLERCRPPRQAGIRKHMRFLSTKRVGV